MSKKKRPAPKRRARRSPRPPRVRPWDAVDARIRSATYTAVSDSMVQQRNLLREAREELTALLKDGPRNQVRELVEELITPVREVAIREAVAATFERERQHIAEATEQVWQGARAAAEAEVHRVLLTVIAQCVREEMKREYQRMAQAFAAGLDVLHTQIGERKAGQV